MAWEGKLQFRTHAAQAHPPKLAERYAVLVRQALEMRSVALECGQLVSLAAQEEGDELCDSLRRVADLVSTNSRPDDSKPDLLMTNHGGAGPTKFGLGLVVCVMLELNILPNDVRRAHIGKHMGSGLPVPG